MIEYKKRYLRASGLEYTMEFFEDFTKMYPYISLDELSVGDKIDVIKDDFTYKIRVNENSISIDKVITDD